MLSAVSSYRSPSLRQFPELSFSCRLNDTSSTAVKVPRAKIKFNSQFLDIQQRRFHSALILPRVEDIAAGHPQKIETQDGQRDGESGKDGNVWRDFHISARLDSMSPQLGAGGAKPSPRKLKEDSNKIAWAKSRVTRTKSGAKQLGKFRKKIRGPDSPPMRAASTYSFSFCTSTAARTTRVYRGWHLRRWRAKSNKTRSGRCYQRDRKKPAGKCEQCIDESHHDGVELPSPVSGNSSQWNSDEEGYRNRR